MMSPISSLNYSTYSNGIIIPSSDSVEATTCQIDNSSDPPSSLLNRAKRSNSHFPPYTSTSRSRRAKKRRAQRKPAMDSSKVKDDRQETDDHLSSYQLQNLIIRVERIPTAWTTMALGNGENSAPNDLEKLPETIDRFRDIPSMVPCLQRIDSRFTDGRSAKNQTQDPSESLAEGDAAEFDSSASAGEHPRNRSLHLCHPSCHSPILSRRPEELEHDSVGLLAFDGNGPLPSMENATSDQTQTDNPLSPSLSCLTALSATTNISDHSNKRSLDSSNSERGSIKRRTQKMTSMTVVQQEFCTFYPSNIQRCIDCRLVDSSSSLSMHLGGCRFQYCRKLRFLGENRYAVEGFLTAAQAEVPENDLLCRSNNSGDQPAIDRVDAEHVFMKLAKLFCTMFAHEQTERLTQSEKHIIWKRNMAGWREVCDQCSTTLFNGHYTCQECGFMICIECSKDYALIPLDKRKKFKRGCTHWKSFALSEFIPWSILLRLRNHCVDYLCALNIDYSIRLYQSSRNETLSAFLKTLKIKRANEARHLQTTWSSVDCNCDRNIEFYCQGRLPVFNEWTSANAKHFFQQVWAASCPVLVKRVHINLSPTLWQPESFKEHMIDHHETPALWDCETLTPIPTNETILTRFWDGFERLDVRLRDEDHDERLRIIKLKDWPTKKDFATVFPTRLHDLMKNIPFGDYTRRSYTYQGVTYPGGPLNIVERLPVGLVKPDLGPKLYIAYSQLTSQASKKAGTTNLHVDVSDAVNVLVYVGVGGHGEDGLDKAAEIQQVEAEILDSNLDEAQLQRLRNGERPGALWHLFRADDAKKIRDYLDRTRRKSAGSDSIHDQTAYLEKEDLDKLREWSRVESYPMLQFLGDAVFIPSGAPHQVKNLHSCIKIAEDFVSPENLDRCLITTNEFRSLSKTHSNHADILQAKNILFYATRDAFAALDEFNRSNTSIDSSKSDQQTD